MIRLSLTRADASVMETETLTAGRVGLECAFTFNSDWDGLEKVAVFEGTETIEVALGTANVAVVPPECMATAGYNLRCGAYGMSATRAIVIPTIWAKAGKIKDSAAPDESLADFTPTLAAQVIAKADSAEETANTIAERASRGEFDGFSPYVGVTEIENGHRVSITDSVGTNEFDVMDGADGADGDSPTIAVSDITGGHVLTITDINGTRTVNVLNGEDGAAGADGYSPTVTVTTITGGHRVTITDVDGAHTFDVMDGEDGSGSTEEVFWATYGTTTNAEIERAYLQKKAVFVRDNGHVYMLVDRTASSYHIFGTVLTGGRMLFCQCMSDTWTTLDSYTIPTKTSDLTNDSGFVDSTGAASAAPVQSVNGQTGAVTVSVPSAATSAPANLGASASVGNGTTWARSNHVHKRPTATEVGAIPAPSSPTSGQFLVYNGTSWAATTVPNASGVSF